MRREECNVISLLDNSVFDTVKRPEKISSSGLQGLSSDAKIVTFCVLRELAFQISEQFEALGSSIGVKCGEYYFIHMQWYPLYLKTTIKWCSNQAVIKHCPLWYNTNTH